MTLTVSLSLEEESALIKKARAQGVTVDSLVGKAVRQIIAAPPEPDPRQRK